MLRVFLALACGLALAAVLAGQDPPLIRNDDELPKGAVLRLRPPDGELSTVYCVAFSPDGKTIATGSADKSICIWDATTGKRLRQFPAHSNEVWTVAFSPDGKLLASGGRADFTLRTWDPATGKALEPFLGHQGGIPRLIFSRDGKTLFMAGGSWDPTIRVWDVTSRKQRYALKGHTDYIDSIALSSDETLLASGSRDGTVRLWDLTARRELRPFPDTAEENGFKAIALSPDGATLATIGNGGGVRLREVASRKQRLHIGQENTLTECLAFSPDGRILLTGGSDCQIHLIDVRTGKKLAFLRGHSEEVKWLAFSPDGRRLASASQDGTVLIWDATRWPQPAAAPAAELSPEQLNAEWERLGSDADQAYQALWALVARPEQSVPLIRDRLPPVPPTDPDRLARLVTDLGSPRFTVRETATSELAQLGDRAGAGVRRAVLEASSPEVRRRAEALLEKLDPISSHEQLRGLRCVEALEKINSPEARKVLRGLAGGSRDSRLTRAAQASLDRMKR